MIETDLFLKYLACDAAAIVVTESEALDTWIAETKKRAHTRFAHLAGDPKQAYPGLSRLCLFAFAYRPYADKQAAPDAYYIAQTRARETAETIAARLTADGYRAVAHPEIPLKAAFAQAGYARYGRNGLLSFGAHGTRVALTSLLTDAPIAFSPKKQANEQKLDDACRACHRCVRACPVHALSDDGRVSPDLCLRGLDAASPIPEALRPMIAHSLLGCDLCQRACPRNARVQYTAMPASLSAASDLGRILAGEAGALAPFIGSNYARKKRLQARACVVAANMDRRDLLPLLYPLARDAYPALCAHAQWAIARLTERG